MNRRQMIKTAALGPLALGALEGIAQQNSVHEGAGTAGLEPVPVAGNRLARIAERLKPELHKERHPLVAEVLPVKSSSAYLRWEMQKVGSGQVFEQKLLNVGDVVYLDFGRHITGYLHFDVSAIGINIDSPSRVRLTYGEVPGDVAEEFYPYLGELSAAWLPDEVVNLESFPLAYTASRRHAFRYVKLEILAQSHKFSARFQNCYVDGVSSASGVLPPLAAGTPQILVDIDRVALNTLKDCMQTVFEDGPRRDQRLWIGDFRLQALASYATYRNPTLVKRCLYLLAAFPQKDGMLSACVFEKPFPHLSGDVILDYAAIYNMALCEYLEETGDLGTVRDLWPTASLQMDLMAKFIDANGVFVDPGNLWIFIDWDKNLHRDAAAQGVILCALRSSIALAAKLGQSAAQARFTALHAKMLAGAAKAFYDAEKQLFVSGPNRQVSWASQAWLCLAGVLPRKQAAELLVRAQSYPGIEQPGTPYLNHYIVEAFVSCGLDAEARQLITAYWGGMVSRGADTFWEVYDSNDSKSSPYGDVHINSFCHAWSCTATWFLRAKRRTPAG